MRITGLHSAFDVFAVRYARQPVNRALECKVGTADSTPCRATVPCQAGPAEGQLTAWPDAAAAIRSEHPRFASGVASLGKSKRTSFALEFAGAEFGVDAEASLVVGVSGGLSVLMC